MRQSTQGSPRYWLLSHVKNSITYSLKLNALFSPLSLWCWTRVTFKKCYPTLREYKEITSNYAQLNHNIGACQELDSVFFFHIHVLITLSGAGWVSPTIKLLGQLRVAITRVQLAGIHQSHDGWVEYSKTISSWKAFHKYSQKLAASPPFLLAPAPITQKLWPYIPLA